MAVSELQMRAVAVCAAAWLTVDAVSWEKFELAGRGRAVGAQAVRGVEREEGDEERRITRHLNLRKGRQIQARGVS